MSAKGSKAPDWSKFGLDNSGNGGSNGSSSERQPLTSGGGGSGQQQQQLSGNPVGSQIQHDSELFADDQVR